MLSGAGNSASKTLELEVPGSATFDYRKSEDGADVIRLKIHKLEQELKRLQEQLERQGND